MRLYERAILTAGLVIFFVAGYFGVGLTRSPAQAYELTTALDERVPFIAISVWAYLWGFPSALIPLFVVRCPVLFRRTAIAYGAVIAASLVSFALFPVTSAHLRVTQAALDVSRPSDWAIAVLYALDPPYNLFPSLHLSIAAVAALAVRKAAKLYGLPIFLSIALVSVAVCTVKQHCVLDVFGGLGLAALAGSLILRPYRPVDGSGAAYSWRGPAMYLGLVAVLYASVYLAYLMAFAARPM